MDAVPSDADCLARSLSEPTAFAPIFDRHFGAIHRYLHRRAGRDLADELAAETFALAFERRASCRASGQLLPWLYGIATNLLHRHRRVERRQLDAYARSGVNHWVAYEDDAAARVGDSSHGAQLARALAAMPSAGAGCAAPLRPGRPQLRRDRLRTRRPGRDRGHVASPGASDRTTRTRQRRRTLSLSRPQELIGMNELDLFRDFSRGVATPSADAQRRASARLASAIDEAVGREKAARLRQGRRRWPLVALAAAILVVGLLATPASRYR